MILSVLTLFSYLFVLSESRLYPPISNKECDCIVKNDTLSNMMNGNINPVVGYGYEWWYNVLNLNIYYGIKPYDLSIVFYFGRVPITDCNSLENNNIFGYIDIKSSLDGINNNYQFATTGSFDINYHYIDKNQEWTITRTNNRFTINVKSKNDTLIIVIGDGRGIYPQGDKGFSRSGPNKCDTAYAYSLLRTMIYGVYKNMAFNGLGYGEHVIGTMKTEIPVYNGWHCHYIHDMQKMEDYQICISDRIDNKVDIYQRGLALNIQKNLFELDMNNIFTEGFGNFNTFKVDWNISIEYDNIKRVYSLSPTFEDQRREVFGFQIWEGFVMGKLAPGIIGINELVNL
jgi:hypothetical protein